MLYVRRNPSSKKQTPGTSTLRGTDQFSLSYQDRRSIRCTRDRKQGRRSKRSYMMYYRVALQESQATTWQWKSTVLTSLHAVLGLLNIFRCVPKEHIRVFLSTTPEQMDEMLSQANQGLLSTAVTVDQLWDKHC